MRKIRFRFVGKCLCCCLDITTACDYIAKEFKDNFKNRDLLDDKLEEIFSWGQDAALGDRIDIVDGVALEPYIPAGFTKPLVAKALR